MSDYEVIVQQSTPVYEVVDNSSDGLIIEVYQGKSGADGADGIDSGDFGSPIGSTISHTVLQDIGENTHPQIDTHITNQETLYSDTFEPTGFVNSNTDSDVAFDEGTRTFSIQPSSGSYSYYFHGTKVTKTGTDSVVVPDTEGNHWIVFNSDGELESKHSSFFTTSEELIEYILRDNVYVVEIYWDATNSKVLLFDERHGMNMAWETHRNLHLTRGTQYISGLAPASFTTDGDGDSDDQCQFQIGSGVILDEDRLDECAEKVLDGDILILYRSGADGDWRWTTDSAPIINASGGNNRATWNEFTGSEWVQTEVQNTHYVLAHILATNELQTNNLFAILGQEDLSTLNNARAAAETELGDILAAGGLPFAEFVAVCTIIFQTDSSYNNTWKSRVREYSSGVPVIQWLSTPIAAGGGVATISLSSAYQGGTNIFLSEALGPIQVRHYEAGVPTSELQTAVPQLELVDGGDQTQALISVFAISGNQIDPQQDIIIFSTDVDNYYIWFSKDGVGPDPLTGSPINTFVGSPTPLTGRTGINVPILSEDSGPTVASKMTTILDAALSECTVTNPDSGREVRIQIDNPVAVPAARKLGGDIDFTCFPIDEGGRKRWFSSGPDSSTLAGGGDYSVRIGQYAFSPGDNSITIGTSARALLDKDIAIGAQSQAKKTGGIAFGPQAISDGSAAISLGSRSQALANFTVALGGNSLAAELGGMAIGQRTESNEQYDLSLGRQTQITGPYTTAIGSFNVINGERMLVLGDDNTSSGITNSMLLGHAIAPTKSNQVVIGSDTYPYYEVVIGGGVETNNIQDTILTTSGAENKNSNGSSLVIRGGYSRGSGNGGSIRFETTIANDVGSPLAPTYGSPIEYGSPAGSPVYGSPLTSTYKNKYSTILEINTSDMIFTGTGTLNVSGTTNYEDLVSAGDDDVIPNKAYVDSTIKKGIINETGTERTLSLTDANSVIYCSNGSDITINIPAAAGSPQVDFAEGTEIYFIQTGAGQITIQGKTGVTLNHPNLSGSPQLALTTRTQFSAIGIILQTGDVWYGFGDMVNS